MHTPSQSLSRRKPCEGLLTELNRPSGRANCETPKIHGVMEPVFTKLTTSSSKSKALQGVELLRIVGQYPLFYRLVDPFHFLKLCEGADRARRIGVAVVGAD